MFLRILWVSLIGGLINLDEHSAIQSMVCRPIIASPTIGYLLGDLNTGLVIGIMLELILFNVLPFGAAMPINFSIIAITATALAIFISESYRIPIVPSFIVWIIMCTVPLGLVFRELENMNRRFNIHLVHFAEKRILEGRFAIIEWITAVGILVSYLKAIVFIMIAIYGGLYLLPKLYLALPAKVLAGLETAYMLVFILGIAVVVSMLRVDFKRKNEKDNIR